MSPKIPQSLKIVAATLFALVAFAANSVLCRMALVGDQAMDAASFTVIRLLSGIFVLLGIVILSRSRKTSNSWGSWRASIYLFIYAVAFSFGYISLDTGVGALILFGSVQLTMIIVGLFRGDRLIWIEWLGTAAAFAGFLFLILPSLSTPSFVGFILMSLAGIGWGLYTLAGRQSQSPLCDTAFNFLRTLPFTLLLIVVCLPLVSITPKGVILAAVSGGLASGVGYAVWYFALSGLKAIQAAVLQLLVPILAALGGVLYLDEAITLRLLVSSVVVLGGIGMVIFGRHYFKQGE